MTERAADATATRLTGSLDQVIEIETPEQVTVTVTIAGIGSRAAAAAIDALLIVLLILAAWLLLVAPGFGNLGEGSVVLAIGLLATFAIFWGYYVLFEGLRDGQTPGKRLLHLRVVQDGGYSVSFAASVWLTTIGQLGKRRFSSALPAMWSLCPCVIRIARGTNCSASRKARISSGSNPGSTTRQSGLPSRCAM